MSLWSVDVIRRNHALEHATIALLQPQMAPGKHLSGRSTLRGFYLYGDVPTPLVEAAALGALARLREGESSLAISDQCGTNLAVAGVLSGLAALLAVGRGRRLERLPQGLLAALAAGLLAQPLGRWVQGRLTTQPQVGRMAIAGVERRQRGPWTVHLVRTSGG